MAKYTIESLEEIRKQRTLTRNEYAALWRLKNPERLKEIVKKASAKYYANNKEKHLACAADWAERNKDKLKIQAAERHKIKQAVKVAEREKYASSPEGVAQQLEKTKIKNARRKLKACENSKRWRENNLEKAKEISRRSREKNFEKRRANMAAWREANKDHIRAYQALYDERVHEVKCAKRRQKTAENPEPDRLRRKEWNKRNPDWCRANKRLRRLRKKNVGGSHTQAEIDALLVAQGGCCANPYCGADLSAVQKHLDHVRAITLGGTDNIDNLAWLCAPCNQRKTNFDVETWLARERARCQNAPGPLQLKRKGLAA